MTNTGTGRLLDTVARALAALEDSIARRERVRCTSDESDWGAWHYDTEVSAARNELVAAVTTLAKLVAL